MMKQAEHAEAFEQVLISYAEMCYSVAFALTRNPHQAQDLARHVLTWAWHLGDSADVEKGIKKRLLNVLRERFLQDYYQVPCSFTNEAALAETA
jgi:DNA-directed RNA polymerase specialized sigma24 family protein